MHQLDASGCIDLSTTRVDLSTTRSPEGQEKKKEATGDDAGGVSLGAL